MAIPSSYYGDTEEGMGRTAQENNVHARCALTHGVCLRLATPGTMELNRL